MHSYPAADLGIRPLTLADAKEFLTLSTLSNPTLLPWLQAPTNMADFEQMVHRQTDGTFVAMGLWNLPTMELIGMVNLSQIYHGAFKSAYLSYWLGKGHTGHGRMREGMRLVLHFAFDHLHLHRLEANIQPGNHRSITLVQAVGFVREGYSEKYLQVLGEWKDHERWAIHHEIWPERDFPAHLRPILC